MTLTGQVHELEALRADAPGWRGLLDGLRVALERRSERAGFDVRVDQVKEKFGGLRFYYGVVDPPTVEPTEADDAGRDRRVRDAVVSVAHLVDAAETASFLLCYLCGAGATRRGSGSWVHYFCDEHDTVDLARHRGGTP